MLARLGYSVMAIVLSMMLGIFLLHLWYCPAMYHWLQAMPQYALLLHSVAFTWVITIVMTANLIGVGLVKKIMRLLSMGKNRNEK